MYIWWEPCGSGFFRARDVTHDPRVPIGPRHEACAMDPYTCFIRAAAAGAVERTPTAWVCDFEGIGIFEAYLLRDNFLAAIALEANYQFFRCDL